MRKKVELGFFLVEIGASDAEGWSARVMWGAGKGIFRESGERRGSGEIFGGWRELAGGEFWRPSQS